MGDYRVVSRALVIPRTITRGDVFGPLVAEPVAQAVAYVQYAKPEATVEHTINRVRLFLAFGVLGGTLLAFLGGLYVAERAMRPIAGPHPGGARGGAHARPRRHPAQAARQRRGVGPRPHLRGHAARAGRRPRRDRGDARAPARLRGRRLARAAHAADEHPRQPRAARVRAGGRAARDGRLGAALLQAHAPPGRRPAAAGARGRRARGAAGAARPGGGRARGRQGGRRALLGPPALARPPGTGHDHRRGRRPAPARRQPGRERADPHRPGHAGHRLGAARGRLGRARGGRPRPRRARRAARARLRALRPRRRGHRARRRQRPRAGDREGGRRRPRRPRGAARRRPAAAPASW